MPSKSDWGSQTSQIHDSKYRNTNIQRQQPTNTHLQNNPWEFENPWSHNLCDLTAECNETCYTFWCFPCFTCHLAWRMNESCWITCCLPGYLAVLRTKMRTAFRIEVMKKNF